MTVKQLSVFLENKLGSLEKVLETLASNGVNIIALSLADSSEFGMLRMIVSEPERGKMVLKESDFSAMITEVLCIRVPHDTGSLSKAVKILLNQEISIEYMYAFANGEDASAVVKVNDNGKALEVLRKNNMKVWSGEEVYEANVKK